jgi:hypothetical protein
MPTVLPTNLSKEQEEAYLGKVLLPPPLLFALFQMQAGCFMCGVMQIVCFFLQ